MVAKRFFVPANQRALSGVKFKTEHCQKTPKVHYLVSPLCLQTIAFLKYKES